MRCFLTLGASIWLAVGLLQSPPAAAQEEGREGPSDQGAFTHVVREGDTLWSLAQQYYNNPYEWPRLWSFNPEITNPHWIYPGLVIRLRPEGEQDGLGIIAANSDFGHGVKGATKTLKRFSSWQSGNVILREQAYLDRDALRESGLIVGSAEDHALLSPSDTVYIRFERPPEGLVGKELTIYRHIRRGENQPYASKLPDPPPAGGAPHGELVRVMGAVKVRAYDPKTRVARAEVVEAMEPIERGYRVADAPRRFVRVPPRTSTINLEATVVSTVEPLGLYGDNQVVFLNVGSEDGVLPGYRFRVVRRGDAWRATLMRDERSVGAARPVPAPPPEDAYPLEVVGEILALHTRPHSTTGLVTQSRLEIEPGDRARLTDGY